MDFTADVARLLSALEEAGGRVDRRTGEPPTTFGCAELDALCAAVRRVDVEHVSLDCDTFGEDDSSDFEGVFHDSGFRFEAIGPLVRMTDEGVGPDGFYAECVGDRARVWWIGHDPYLADDLGSLLDWVAARAHAVWDPLDPLPDPPGRTIDEATFGPFSFHGRALRYQHADGTVETLDLVVDAGNPVIGPWPPILGHLLGRLVLSVPVGTSTRRFRLPSTWSDAELRHFRQALSEARNAPAVSQGTVW